MPLAPGPNSAARRLPGRLLALFIAVLILPAAALLALGWRLVEQDRALERQRRQEYLEHAAPTCRRRTPPAPD